MKTDLNHSPPPPVRPQEESCMTAIMKLIRDGSLPLSERIGEASLATRLGVGLAAIRTALNRLATIGIIYRVPRSGSFVRRFSIQDFSQITDVRCSLECLAVRLATLSAKESDIEELRSLAVMVDQEAVDPLLKSSGDEIWTFERDRDFHLRIAHLANNAWLTPILESQHFLEMCFLVELQFGRLAIEQLRQIPNHQAVVDAIHSRNIHNAETTMRKHILMHKEIRARALLGEFIEDQ